MSKWLILFLMAIGFEFALFIYIHYFQTRKISMKDIQDEPALQGQSPEETWAASYSRPIILLALIGIFGVFIVVALIAGKEQDTVRNLVTAGITACFASILSMASKVQFQLYDVGISKIKPAKKKNELIFRWDELKEIRHGFDGITFILKDELEQEAKLKKRGMKGWIPAGRKTTEIMNLIKHKFPSLVTPK